MTSDVRADIERCAEAVLATREAHPYLTSADMYDPDKMPDDLKVAHLFKLYAELTEGE